MREKDCHTFSSWFDQISLLLSPSHPSFFLHLQCVALPKSFPTLHHLHHRPHRLSPSRRSSSPAKSPEDVVIVSAVRTAIGRAKKGAFKDTHPTELLAAVLKGVLEKSGVKSESVGDIVVGNVLAPGGFATQARMAMFLAGFPETVPSTYHSRLVFLRLLLAWMQSDRALICFTRCWYAVF